MYSANAHRADKIPIWLTREKANTFYIFAVHT